MHYLLRSLLTTTIIVAVPYGALAANADKPAIASQNTTEVEATTSAKKSDVKKEAHMSEVHTNDKHARVHIEDYTPYSHLMPTTNLVFDIKAVDDVTVTTKMHFAPNPEVTQWDGTLVLNGAPEKRAKGDNKPTMELVSITLNGEALEKTDYTRKGEELVLLNVPKDEFDVEVVTHFDPTANKALAGLYLAGDKLLTQCESTGFRNMTFFPDRSDVLSVYTTTIIGDEERFPSMVSNGDETSRATLDDGRTSITYLDATPKPSYLFALAAGNFDVLRDTYTIGQWRGQNAENKIKNSRSGEKVNLEVYVEPGDYERGKHAMQSLKIAMEMDEEKFDREYDINTYRMVATNHFNMGAMENKGLNIFNSKYLLADPETATDADYENVFRVIAHEYAHNWSGNRVTVKDWFEITLKEGFTNFRDQEFTGEYTDHDVKRIEDVNSLRGRQFAEDASANAHPIRPDSYLAIDNLYTGTIYDKGAEVIRMMKTMVGDEKFKEGVNYYFSKNDGKAVRSDDFVAAIAEKGGVNLDQFKDTWYKQAGTPTLTVTDSYDADAQTYTLTIEQHKPMVNVLNFPKNDPYHIPIKMGLLDANGNDISLELHNDDGKTLTNNNSVLNLREKKQSFTFVNVPVKPLPSLLRGFSAPVKLNYDYSRDDLMFMLANDNDNFNRWEAGQQLAVDVLMEQVAAAQSANDVPVDSRLIETYRKIITDNSLSSAVKAHLLRLPSSSYVYGLYDDGKVDVDAIDAAYKKLRRTISEKLESELKTAYEQNTDTMQRPYSYNQNDVAEREIRHTSLDYLLEHPKNDAYIALAKKEYDAQQNKTDVLAGLIGVVNEGTAKQREDVLTHYYTKWKDEPLMMNTWLSVQALRDDSDVLKDVQRLIAHDAYEATNPNSVRALLGSYAANKVHFHRKDGKGYVFLADKVLEADAFNPQLSSALVGPLLGPEKYDDHRRKLMLEQLVRISSQENLSDNLREKVENALAANRDKVAALSPKAKKTA
ncbi:MAG: aminopeptidase N [Alphaproteobacteria bacterium]|nr:aminopeptidase N [Alphaproteobacteria bacterium]